MGDYYAAVWWCDGWLPAVVVGRRYVVCLFCVPWSLSSRVSCLVVWVWYFGGTDEGLKAELGCVGGGGWVRRRDG